VTDHHGAALLGPGEVVVVGAGRNLASRTVLTLDPRAGGDLEVVVYVRGQYLDGSWSGELGRNEAARFVGTLLAHACDRQAVPFGDADTVVSPSVTWPARRAAEGSVLVRLPLAGGRLDTRIDADLDRLRRVASWVLRFATVLGAPRDRRLHPLFEAW
jgi:hypothetical protein